LYLIVPPIFDPEREVESRRILEHGYGTAANATKVPTKKVSPGKWTKPMDKLANQGVEVMVTVKITIKHIAWHRRGDYVATTSPEGS
jgi:ribosome biogenesis protein ERB1